MQCLEKQAGREQNDRQTDTQTDRYKQHAHRYTRTVQQSKMVRPKSACRITKLFGRARDPAVSEDNNKTQNRHYTVYIGKNSYSNLSVMNGWVRAWFIEIRLRGSG